MIDLIGYFLKNLGEGRNFSAERQSWFNFSDPVAMVLSNSSSHPRAHDASRHVASG